MNSSFAIGSVGCAAGCTAHGALRWDPNIGLQHCPRVPRGDAEAVKWCSLGYVILQEPVALGHR